jgi:hypothetical protein
MRRRAAILLAIALLAAAAVFGASLARGERAQKENLIVSLNGGITPRTLPRSRPAPVAVHLAGKIMTTDDSPLPRVNWIKLELAWRGRLFTHGLPICPRPRLAFTDDRHALDACGGALVGRGGIFAEIFVPGQESFGIHTKLLAFNGRTSAGRPTVWVHAYSADPPVSFVLPFTVHHQPGSFRTVLIATIRRSVGPWPHVANFHISISRNFTYRGKERSYLTASCPIPANFTAGFLSFARASYTFAGGVRLRPQAVRSCRAR